MKKILTGLVLSALCASAFGATTPSPEMLKDKSLFEKVDLFEPPQIFSDKAANAALLRDYEANPSSYKTSQLMPIAVCYLSFGDLKKSKAAFEAYLSSNPKNLRAIRTLGTISLLSKDIDKAIEYYKRAIADGDKKSVVFLCSAYIMSNKMDEIKPYLDTLKNLAKTDLEALNVVLIYAGKDKKNFDEALLKETLANIDARKVLETATPDGMSTILRIYIATRNLWNASAIVVPARAAALAEAWPLAMSAYKKILEEQPDNPLALRGISVVAFRTGDVFGSADYIMKAYKLGDKEAAADGINLFLFSRNISIWKMFEKLVDDLKLSPQVRAGLVQFAVGQDDCADMFYRALSGEKSKLLFEDEGVVKLIEEGVKKYSSDARAAEITKRLQESKK